MYKLNYFRDKSESGTGYYSQTITNAYTWIGILYGMLRYLVFRSIKCYEVVDVLNDKVILSWSRK